MNREFRALMIAATVTFAAAHSAQADLAKKQVLKVQQLIKSADIKGLNRFVNNNNWIFDGSTPLEQALARFSEALMLKKPVEITAKNWAILVDKANAAASIY